MGNRSVSLGDRIAECSGAVALFCGAGGATWLVAARLGFQPISLAAAAALLGGFIGWGIVRLAPGGAATPKVARFVLEPWDDIISPEPPVEDLPELLLDQRWAPDGPRAEVVVVSAQPSRVVQLFDPANAPPSKPAELQARIEAHLRDGQWEARMSPGVKPPLHQSGPDASDALHAALDGIRRSLRAG